MFYIIFLMAAAAVIFAGVKLSIYGDVIAEKTGLGESFVGLTLVAASTSLPEIISSIGSVTVVQSPDLAFGNAYGSNMFNMFIIFILDAVYRKGSILVKVSPSNVTTGLFSILLTMISGFGFILDMPTIGWMNPISFAIIGGYLIAMYTAYRLKDDIVEPDAPSDITLSKAATGFAVAAFIIVVSGLALSKSADYIATDTGLGGSFVGTLLLALVTSLPELAFCFPAVRSGMANMAIGNLVGSNVFNMTVIPIADAFYVKTQVFADVSAAHLGSALFTSIAAGLLLLGIEVDKKLSGRMLSISLISWALALFYILNLAFVYFKG
ncbi:sodium:calcium antiporter [Limisalsivibrio acetivorans]|uniref:sodium:calcium antiporter n=1 Tax=Limisalsivibrio acetivorans TaxID=1304888 RepID=UPI0003B7721C|nr:sodium:calcium antiporter [Limisalsivibrio acetivorans]